MLWRDPPDEVSWSALIPPEQAAVLRDGAEAIESTGAPFLLAGALALATYTGHWRNTKDIDVVIHSKDRELVIDAVRRAGFEDYHDREPYDRSWIFRGFKDGVLFDVIWALPNHRVGIDDFWFERGRGIVIQGRSFLVAPAEEIIRIKLYVMQRERCDWVDVLNIMAASVESISWPWLVDRMGRDLPLLHAALAIFNWMCPGRAHALPAWLRQQFALPRIESEDFSLTEQRRVRLFDSRPWFAPHQPADQPLER
ncbi:MAG: hypothetical protein ABIS43_15450 [Opitutus sp.]